MVFQLAFASCILFLFLLFGFAASVVAVVILTSYKLVV
jgi:hypothetical protein